MISPNPSWLPPTQTQSHPGKRLTSDSFTLKVQFQTAQHGIAGIWQSQPQNCGETSDHSRWWWLHRKVSFCCLFPTVTIMNSIFLQIPSLSVWTESWKPTCCDPMLGWTRLQECHQWAIYKFPPVHGHVWSPFPEKILHNKTCEKMQSICCASKEKCRA